MISRSGAVLLLATSPDADPRWPRLVHDYAASDHGTQLTVLAHPATGAGSVPELLGTIRRLAPPSGFSVIAADSPREHYAALLYRALAAHPVTVMKTRGSEPLPRTRWSRWLNCKQTGVNLVWTHADEARHRGTKGALFLDRPFVLTQPKLGADSPRQMLDHAVRSLTRPARNSLSGAKQDHSGIGLTYITHFYLNQSSTATIFDLLKKYASYDPAVMDRVHFVIVDDGSPLAYEIPPMGLNITWLKVKPDIPWNNPGSRNLGVVYAKSDKILVTDVDHEFPEDTLRYMIEHRGAGKRIYKLFRRDPASGELERGHPNIFFMSRARFFELYGYDEEFCGAYASDDYRFVKYQKAAGTLTPHLPRRYWCADRPKIDRKQAYHSLVRDLSFNTPVDRRKDIELQWHGRGAGHSRMFLNFQWDILSEQRRETRWQPPLNRWWKPLWWLRAILPRW